MTSYFRNRDEEIQGTAVYTHCVLLRVLAQSRLKNEYDVLDDDVDTGIWPDTKAHAPISPDLSSSSDRIQAIDLDQVGAPDEIGVIFPSTGTL